MGNTPPEVVLSFAEDTVRTTDDLVPEWTVSDADGDPVSVVWTWTVDGEDTFFDEAAVLSRETRVGQVWTLELSPRTTNRPGTQPRSKS